MIPKILDICYPHNIHYAMQPTIPQVEKMMARIFSIMKTEEALTLFKLLGIRVDADQESSQGLEERRVISRQVMEEIFPPADATPKQDCVSYADTIPDFKIGFLQSNAPNLRYVQPVPKEFDAILELDRYVSTGNLRVRILYYNPEVNEDYYVPYPTHVVMDRINGLDTSTSTISSDGYISTDYGKVIQVNGIPSDHFFFYCGEGEADLKIRQYLYSRLIDSNIFVHTNKTPLRMGVNDRPWPRMELNRITYEGHIPLRENQEVVASQPELEIINENRVLTDHDYEILFLLHSPGGSGSTPLCMKFTAGTSFRSAINQILRTYTSRSLMEIVEVRFT